MIGEKISHFRILRELGRGGMGVVYVARDVDLERDVALKFLPAQFTHDDSATQRFIAEARAASGLDHENICAVHEIGRTDDGMVFIAMAYYSGRTLKDLIAEGPLAHEQARDIAAQIAAGLVVAHERGIVHRDIKPANIVVTDRGQAKILDFGLAKLVADTTGITKTGTTVGTVAYMSPEQLRGENVDARSDVWSLGIVLYEMLAKRLPFAGDHPAALSYAIVHEPHKPIAQYRSDVPPAIVHVLERALKKNASERYSSCAEMLADLRAGSVTAGASRPRVSRRGTITAVAVLAVTIAAFLFWQRTKSNRVQWSREVALPEIEHLTDDRSTSSEQPDLWRAYELAAKVEEIVPDEPRLQRLRPRFAREIHIRSVPPGASVRARSYGGPDDAWRAVGRTPLDLWFPLGISRIELALDGHATATEVVLNNHFVSDSVSVTLHRPEDIPPGMVWVNDWSRALALPGLEGLAAQHVRGFWVDRCEVSNREYKSFVDAGGYQKPEYWKTPFVDDGKVIAFEDAMSRFVDATGRTGPATWEASDYPDATDNDPVGGISWYEAAAYAEFIGKQLPTIYHWNAVALTIGSAAIVPPANFGGRGAEPVDSGGAVHRSGALNLAGNVREWCWNETDAGDRFILGGGWSDQPYGFNDAYAQPPFDRSVINGFRCIKVVDVAHSEPLAHSIAQSSRDFRAEKPVGDDIFAHILKQYAYDALPLNARTEDTRDDNDWIREKISFDAAYPNARVIAYLFVPKNVEPPYQTVVFFPGSGDLYQKSSELMRIDQFDFFIKSGRAVLYPVYNGMFERGGVVPSDQPSEATAYRDWTISMERDLSRSIDYLATRPDIDSKRLAYYGLSMGGRIGPLMLAVERRFKAAILYVAGLKFQRALPEADAFNFASRVTLPVLMVNARYDFFFPIETSQRPLFELLGTPQADKKWVVYDGGHSVPRSKLIAESLAWLDHYLGPVERSGKEQDAGS